MHEGPRHRRRRASSARTSSTACWRPAIEPRIFDLRPSPHHEPGDGRHRASATCSTARRCARRCAAATRSSTSPPPPTSTRSRSDPAEAEAASTRAARSTCSRPRAARASRASSTPSTIWVYCDADAARSTRTRARAARPPLHGDQARRRDVLPLLRELYGLECTILRFGIPYGPRARPAAVIPIFVRKALAGEPLTIAGERPAVAPLRLRRGPRRGRRARRSAPQAAGRTYNLVGDEERDDPRRSPRRCATLVGDVEIVHTPARAADFAGAEVSRRARRRASSAGAPRRRSPRACGATSTGTVATRRDRPRRRPARSRRLRRRPRRRTAVRLGRARRG